MLKRREFLKRSVTTGALALTPALVKSLFAASMPADPVDFSALELSRAIREQQISCLEVMQAYLAHIQRYNPVYNAIVSMADDQSLLDQARQADAALARGEYRGWMHGMPQAIKDLTNLAGFPNTSGGSPIYANRIPDTDSAMVARIRAAGAIFIGKTNSPEFGLGSQSYNPLFGATGSAWNPDLTAGGSSGGAASGLGTHMLPVADGSDMMGSLRNPGAFNNVIGFRPSTNVIRDSDAGSRALSTSGPMGRNTGDTIRFLSTIAARPMPESLAPLELPGIRIGWLGDLDGYLAMEPGVLELCEAGLATLATAGADIESAQLGMSPSDLWLSWTTLRHASRGSLKRLYDDPATRPLLKPEAVWEVEQLMQLSDADRVAANSIRSDWYRELERLFDRYDFLALPSAQVFPFAKDDPWPRQINGVTMDTYHRWMEVVIPGSLGGTPVLNVPVGFDARSRPMGMQIMGRFADDQRVLQFGLAYEQLTDFLQRRPPLVPA